MKKPDSSPAAVAALPITPTRRAAEAAALAQAATAAPAAYALTEKQIGALTTWYNKKIQTTGKSPRLQFQGVFLFEELVNYCAQLLDIQLNAVCFVTDKADYIATADEHTLCIAAGSNQLVFLSPQRPNLIKFNFNLMSILNAGRQPNESNNAWETYLASCAAQIKREHLRSIKCLPEADVMALHPTGQKGVRFVDVTYDGVGLPMLVQRRGSQNWNSIPVEKLDELLLECYQRMFRTTRRLVVDSFLKNFVLLGEGENKRLVCCDSDQHRRFYYQDGYETDYHSVDEITQMACGPSLLPKLLKRLLERQLTRSALWMRAAYALTFHPEKAAAAGLTPELLADPKTNLATFFANNITLATWPDTTADALLAFKPRAASKRPSVLQHSALVKATPPQAAKRARQPEHSEGGSGGGGAADGSGDSSPATVCNVSVFNATTDAFPDLWKLTEAGL